MLGRLIASTDANGDHDSLNYDARDRVTSIRYGNGAQAQFTYDAKDNTLTARDPNTNLAFTYDADQSADRDVR